jgi:hypothetical protein
VSEEGHGQLQCPAVQEGCGPQEQTFPHAPQLAGSAFVFTHEPLHAWFGCWQKRPHVPLLHTCPA